MYDYHAAETPPAPPSTQSCEPVPIMQSYKRYYEVKTRFQGRGEKEVNIRCPDPETGRNTNHHQMVFS